jgi:hypothetical protein
VRSKEQLVRVVVAALLLTFVPPAGAQTVTDPALHHRGDTPAQGQPSASGKQRGTSMLPASASGEYMMDETGSVVQITIDNGVVDGYISKLTEEQTSALTYFFNRTTIDGDRLTFTTKEVHGIWYSFDGEIIRDASHSKQENGYYRLKGTWVTHDETQKSQSTSTVNLKSTPRRD